jgi:glyoxylase-like metal-dependent hydrolase (beta-lactamase superfamily II)
VIQVGDLFFSSMYPYIDSSTGGKITGMIAAANKILLLADNDTKIVAGHARSATERGRSATERTSRDFGICWALRAIASRN